MRRVKTKFSDPPKKRSYTHLLNPMNWGLKDYSSEKSFNTAFEKAKKSNLDEFIWEGRRYNTKSNLSPKQQMKRYGITDSQRTANTPISKRLYTSVRPDDYGDREVSIKAKDFFLGHDRFDRKTIDSRTAQANLLQRDALEAFKVGLEHNKDSEIMGEGDRLYEKGEELLQNLGSDDIQSEDAWRLYLGLPQKNNTFSISDYTPSKSKEKNKEYYALPESFKKTLSDERNISDLLEAVKNGPAVIGEYSMHLGIQDGSTPRVLGNFTIDKGKDKKGEYLSYYDKYDLHPTSGLFGQFDADNIIGKPLEIYDRIYLNDNRKLGSTSKGKKK